MQALISGITGTALLVDGGRFSWLQAGDATEPAIASPAYVRQFVSRALDAFAMENASVESIRTHLYAAWLASGIVSSVLIALNPDETEETRRLACEDLEESLSDALAIELAERQLLSAELPHVYYLPSMLGERSRTFCKRLFDLQRSIAATISAFNKINSSYFQQGEMEFRDKFLATAIREGLMRQIVLFHFEEHKAGRTYTNQYLPKALGYSEIEKHSLESFLGNQKIVNCWLSLIDFGFPMDPSDGSVTRWIRDLKAGNNNALSKLWDRYFPKAKQSARHFFGKDPRFLRDEEDIALSVMGALFNDASLIDVADREDLIRLLLVVTKRKVSSEKRSQKSRSRGGGKVVVVSDLSDLLKNSVSNQRADIASPESLAIMSEQYQILMDSLPDEFYRDIVRLKLKGKTIQEVANDLNVVPRTIHLKLKTIQSTWLEALDKSDLA